MNNNIVETVNQKNMNVRILGLDFLKVLAALMITNAHSKCLYPDGLTALGTFGVPGNALFFLVSGFALGLKLPETEESKSLTLKRFWSWYKKRIYRIWPTVMLWVALLSPLMFGSEITLRKLWIADDYWFVKCIAVYYALYYFISLFAKKWLIEISIGFAFLPVLCFFFVEHIDGSVFEYLKYVSHFGIMLLGAWGAMNKEKLAGTHKNAVLAIVYFILFYALQIKGKGADGFWYNLQITAIVPLMLMSFHAMKWACGCECRFMQKKWAKPLNLIAGLTLEIYVVNVAMITTSFNALFPLNLCIVFCIIVFTAYILRCLTRFIVYNK